MTESPAVAARPMEPESHPTLGAIARERLAAGFHGLETLVRGEWTLSLYSEGTFVWGYASSSVTGEVVHIFCTNRSAHVSSDIHRGGPAGREHAERQTPLSSPANSDLRILVRNWYNGTLSTTVSQQVARLRADQVLQRYPAMLWILSDTPKSGVSKRIEGQTCVERVPLGVPDFAKAPRPMLAPGERLAQALRRITDGASVERELSDAFAVPRWAWRRLATLEPLAARDIASEQISIIETLSELVARVRPDQFPRNRWEWVTAARLIQYRLFSAAQNHPDWRAIPLTTCGSICSVEAGAIHDYLNWHQEIAKGLFGNPERETEIGRVGLVRLKRASDRWHRAIPLLAADLENAEGVAIAWRPWFNAEALSPLLTRGWTARELCTAADLTREGREQQHCVATYIGSALADHCSILALRGPGGLAATIELHCTGGAEPRFSLEQCRGVTNDDSPVAEAVAIGLVDSINAYRGVPGSLFRPDITPKPLGYRRGQPAWDRIADRMGIETLCDRLNDLMIVKVHPDEVRDRVAQLRELRRL